MNSAELIRNFLTERLGVEPAAAAGHSLGEYTALVASGALAFEEGLLLVAEALLAFAPVVVLGAAIGAAGKEVGVADEFGNGAADGLVMAVCAVLWW